VSQSRPGGPGARRPAPPPKEADDRLVTAVLTAGWAIAFAVVLAVRHSLPTDARWWVWTCAFGLAMGLFGLWYVPFLKRHRARLAARRDQLSEISGYVSRESGSNTVSSTETPGRSTKS
jgi:hypothetical protein